MKCLLASIAISVAIASEAVAQEANGSSPSEIREAVEEMREGKEALEDTTQYPLGQRTTTWQALAIGVAGDKVRAVLSDGGWGDDQVDAIPASGKYDLYRKVVAPGVQNYLVVSKMQGIAPVQFGVETEAMKAAFLGSVNPEEVRRQLLDQIEAAIAALCGMEARPTTIMASASAFGVISVQGTWEADKVCGP